MKDSTPTKPPLSAFSSASSGGGGVKLVKPLGINNDSSWITNPSANSRMASSKTSTKKMTDAFQGSMRCSSSDAKAQTSVEARSNCIHVGKLLYALEEMRKCMELHGIQQGTKDLKVHYDKVQLLYKATPLDTRDLLSGLMSSDSKSSKSLGVPSSTSSSSLSSKNTIGAPVAGSETAAAAARTTTTTKTNNNDDLSPSSPLPKPPPQLDDQKQIEKTTTKETVAVDREDAKKSMFWLCYYVRYLYDVHRLVLKDGHDPVDASSMSFMRHLYPHFGHHYEGANDAKTFLKLIADYQTENFIGESELDKQSRSELNHLLGVWEVLLYLWVPVFKEMALKGELTNNLTSGR